LDIFARRARTHEGQLQVELAQHQYLLPRLAGQWSHLERLGGGIGTRGPGESQLETDRRLIRKKIQHLKERLEDVRIHRTLYRQRRRCSGIPIVALIGYTNSGKSTLLNALCHTDVFTGNKLFATLDPTTRRLALPSRKMVLLTDTVGFIKKLPTTIITAFRATLEELVEANMLIHVVDIANSDASERYQAVEEILAGMNLIDKPRCTVLNKVDLIVPYDKDKEALTHINHLAEQCHIQKENSVLISASRNWGLAKLLERISNILKEHT
jgi:GTP-binding protein HflX